MCAHSSFPTLARKVESRVEYEYMYKFSSRQETEGKGEGDGKLEKLRIREKRLGCVKFEMR